MPEFVQIAPLDKTHVLGGFSCGETRIDNYLKNNAWKEHKRYKIRVFCATKPSRLDVIGYYSLTFIVWVQDGVSTEVIRKFDQKGSVPAIYLAKLGVTKMNAGQGIGPQLMQDAFKRSLAIAEHAGVSTLTLEAINEDRAGWYEKKLGFQRFCPGDLRMVISLATLRRAI